MTQLEWQLLQLQALFADALCRGDWRAYNRLSFAIQELQSVALFTQLWPGAQVCQDGESEVR